MKPDALTRRRTSRAKIATLAEYLDRMGLPPGSAVGELMFDLYRARPKDRAEIFRRRNAWTLVNSAREADLMRRAERTFLNITLEEQAQIWSARKPEPEAV